MPTPPAESSPSGDPPQPSVPLQPLHPTPKPTTKPTQSATRKPRQRKRADQQDKSQQQPSQPQPAQSTTPAAQPQVPQYHTGRGPIFQPYPGPYHMMNPSYSMNGPPYGQHPQHPGPHGQPINPSGPPPQYGYPMPGPYTHAYPPYPQYPQPMMVYPPPRQEGPPESTHSEPPESVSAGTKRKRKSVSQGGREQGTAERGSDEDAAGASTSDVSRPVVSQQIMQAPSADLKKRTKTQRACDSCRSRKIRCDIIPDMDLPLCQHCKQYSFECTFFLPITETRFKKKKMEEDPDKEKATVVSVAPDNSNAPASRDPKREIGVFGPTSPYHMLHSQATINPRVYESYDQRYHHSFEVSKSGDGLILVQKPSNHDQQSMPKPSDLHIESDVIEKLVNAYFAEVAPLLPVVTQAEFLAYSNPPSILIYSMCLIAAARREVPQKVFDSIRYIVNSILKADDVLSTASIVNVQSLLILCMTGDCHSQSVPNAISALWIRLGAAIRMAQDLGLHHAEAMKQDIELRRRLWASCLICDRWAAIAYGFPYMIDVQDCDARLPSVGDATDLYMDELVRLSILLGRVQKTIYGPSGISSTTDEVLHGLFNDLKRWKEALPDHLRYTGALETPQTAGLLHLLYSCVSMMFWRVFMRISYSCPAHLKFAMTIEQWTELVKLSSECIDWLDAHEGIYDIWLIVTYAATSCALVQYHTFVRRKDEQAQAKLRKLRDCIRRWEGAISPDHMSARRKTAEIISLLYEATQGPQLPLQAPVLNPTGGVKVKQPVMLDFKQDPSRPGGGIFVAQSKSKMHELKDAPKGLVVSQLDEENGNSEVIGNSFVKLTSLGAPSTNVKMNVNPAMNVQPEFSSGNIQVMNVLDSAASGSNLADFQMADNGFLEGLPGSMFDWGQWDTFFARFGVVPQTGNAGQQERQDGARILR